MRVLEKSGKIPDFILTKKNRANAKDTRPTNDENMISDTIDGGAAQTTWR